MNTTGYNEIDLKNWKNYPEIKTNSFWEYEVNTYEQIYKRYTKRNDLVLNIFCNSESAKEEAKKLDRKYLEIEDYEYDNSLRDVVNNKLKELEQKNIQLLLLTPDVTDIRASKTEEFFNTFKQFAKLGIDSLEQGRFVVLIIGNTYSNSTLHLEAFEYAQFLTSHGLRLKAHIVKEVWKWSTLESSTAKALWHCRALKSGFNVATFKNIFIFKKL